MSPTPPTQAISFAWTATRDDDPMTWLEWLLTRWGRATSMPERHAPGITMQRPKPRVPVEYLSLYTYLDDRYASTVVLTFEQMESLLGFALPAPACTERDGWTDTAASTDRHSDRWTGA